MADAVGSSRPHRRLWRRQPGWHVAAAREQPNAGAAASAAAGAAGSGSDLGTAPSAAVALCEIESALACSTAASCEWLAASSARAPPTCRSCGSALAAASSCAGPGKMEAPAAKVCWACSSCCSRQQPGLHVLSLILQLPVVSAGGLNYRERVAASYCCKAWRTAVCLARIPPRLATRHAGRKWLQGWNTTFERCVQHVPAAVATGGGSGGASGTLSDHVTSAPPEAAACTNAPVPTPPPPERDSKAAPPREEHGVQQPHAIAVGSASQGGAGAGQAYSAEEEAAGKALFRDLKEVCATVRTCTLLTH